MRFSIICGNECHLKLNFLSTEKRLRAPIKMAADTRASQVHCLETIKCMDWRPSPKNARYSTAHARTIMATVQPIKSVSSIRYHRPARHASTDESARELICTGSSYHCHTIRKRKESFCWMLNKSDTFYERKMYLSYWGEEIFFPTIQV